jgi:hypothetical protein
MAAGSGGQQPEQRSVLGFPLRPGGDGGAVQAGRQYWYELAGEIQGAFADIDRAIIGLHWSGEARKAFDVIWSQFSGHATEASQHSHAMGDHLFTLGHQIEDSQHEWDLAMATMVATTAIAVGLTFVTFGISDAVAEGAAATAVGTMETVCGALGISLDAAMEVLIAAARISADLAVKFTWQFTIAVVSQEGANLVQGTSLGNVDLLHAAEFAGVSTLIPGMASKVATGGRNVLAETGTAALKANATPAVSVASGTGGASASMSIVRILDPGEDFLDPAVLHELKVGTFETGNEHAVVDLASGERAVVSGGPTGLDFAEGEISQLLIHTHPYGLAATGPSAADIAAIRALGQESSWLLEHGELIRFSAGGG